MDYSVGKSDITFGPLRLSTSSSKKKKEPTREEKAAAAARDAKVARAKKIAAVKAREAKEEAKEAAKPKLFNQEAADKKKAKNAAKWKQMLKVRQYGTTTGNN